MPSPTWGISANELAKFAVRGFLGLLVVNAVIAIAAILGASGDADSQIVGTSLLLTAGCLAIAANAAAIERQRLTWLPYAGAWLSCIAFGALIVVLWLEPTSDADLIWKPIFITLTLGLSATYASLLAIPSLRGVFRTAQAVGFGAVAILASMTVIAIIVEQGTSPEAYAVLSVVLATATIIVLVGAVVERRAAGVPAIVSPAEVRSPVVGAAVFCPACGSPIAGRDLTHDEHQCLACGFGFRLATTQQPWSV